MECPIVECIVSTKVIVQDASRGEASPLTTNFLQGRSKHESF